MKLILDEWIVREVINTLYMARTTLLGITGLDSPQDVAKKSANETAITRRISKAIDIIQQPEQSSLPNHLEEAAKAYADDINSNECLYTYTDFTDAFKAGAKWDRNQMMKEAVEGEVTDTCGISSIWIKTKQFKQGEKVKLIVIKEGTK